jgi:hypothetical protein
MHDEILRELLLTQLKQSKEFAMDVKDYYRDQSHRTYQFLTSAINQFLAQSQMERNRQSQIALLGGTNQGGKANAAGKGKGNQNNHGAGSNAPKTDTTKLPCFAFQTGECKYGSLEG